MDLTRLPALALAGALAASAAEAGTSVRVTVTGTVSFNQLPNGIWPGDDATLTFLVDSDDFVDPTPALRQYVIEQSSYALTFDGGAITYGMQNPFPAGLTPAFGIRDDDSGSDGFFASWNDLIYGGIPLNASGQLAQLRNVFSTDYDAATLSSLDVLAALGTYDLTGLDPTVTVWSIEDAFVNATIIDFAQIEIAIEDPGPTFYCTAKVNSAGCAPALSSDPGSPSLSGGPWLLRADSLLNNKTGIFFYGLASANLPFQGATLCAAPPLSRTPIRSTAGNPPPNDCSGTLSVDLTVEVDPAFVPGTVYVQCWSRDPADPAGFGTSLSNAAAVGVTP